MIYQSFVEHGNTFRKEVSLIMFSFLVILYQSDHIGKEINIGTIQRLKLKVVNIEIL